MTVLAAKRRLQEVDDTLGALPPAPKPPKSVYIYGSVGSGKSFLMDLFYAVVSKHSLLPYRRRVHFNALMIEMHQRLHTLERATQLEHDAALAELTRDTAQQQHEMDAHTNETEEELLDPANANADENATSRSVGGVEVSESAKAMMDNASSGGGGSSRPVFYPDEGGDGSGRGRSGTRSGVVSPAPEVMYELQRHKDAKLAVMAARRRVRQVGMAPSLGILYLAIPCDP